MLHIRKVGHLILNLYLYIRHILLNFAVQEILQSSLQTKMSLSSISKIFIKQILHERIKGNNHEKTYVVYRNNNCEWHY